MSENINRRAALKRIGLLAGGTLAATTVSAVLTGCGRARAPGEPYRTLSLEQGHELDAMAEVIIPATDTPGAAEAGVTRFIDDVLTDVMAPEVREDFLSGLDAAGEKARSDAGGPFSGLSESDQTAVMTTLMESGEPRLSDGRSYFEALRELTIAGYYTSEIGALREHRMAMSFPSYDGEYRLDQNGGRAWAEHQW